MKWWKLRQAHKEVMDIPQWEEDYKLSPLPDHHMFWEYLEVGKMSIKFEDKHTAMIPHALYFFNLYELASVKIPIQPPHVVKTLGHLCSTVFNLFRSLALLFVSRKVKN